MHFVGIVIKFRCPRASNPRTSFIIIVGEATYLMGEVHGITDGAFAAAGGFAHGTNNNGSGIRKCDDS